MHGVHMIMHKNNENEEFSKQNIDRANLEGWSSLTPFFGGRIGIEWLKLKLKS